MSAPKVDLIRQALSAAESSIKLARQLLSDIEKEGFRNKPKAKELPGTVGIFDGQGMVTEAGEKFPVPENYASKSILVVGDTLKLVEDGGEKRFKQIEHVKRHKTVGILAKKDGKWTAVSSEGSYRVLPASVAHFEGDVGNEALLQLPANSLQVPWAAVEKITKKGAKEEAKPARIASQSDAGGEIKETKEVAKEAKEPQEAKEKAVSAVNKEEKPKEEPKDKEKTAATQSQKGTETQKLEDKPATGEAQTQKASEATREAEAPKEAAKEAPKTESVAEDELR